MPGKLVTESFSVFLFGSAEGNATEDVKGEATEARPLSARNGETLAVDAEVKKGEAPVL